ncbi:hypothetical protein GAC16_26680 [Bacteroides thetaiotaomicron]|nr:hypothetical protein GAC16_26680 [Bacteroides thetaiotaomicron]
MSDVRQLTPAACILVTLPYRSATVWSATKVVLYCRKSKCFPLYLCIYRTFAKTYVRKKTLAAQKKEEAEKRQLSLGFDEQ